VFALADQHPRAGQLGFVDVLLRGDLHIVLEQVLQAAAGDGELLADLLDRQRLVQMLVDVGDNLLQQLVFKVLVDRRRRPGLAGLGIHLQQRDQEGLQGGDHRVVAVGDVLVAALDEVIDQRQQRPRAGKDAVEQNGVVHALGIEDDGQIAAGFIRGDALVMELVRSVDHAAVAGDLIGLAVDLGLQGAVVDVGQFIVFMGLAREHILGALDDIVVGDDLMDGDAGDDALERIGVLQLVGAQLHARHRVQVIDDLACHRHDGEVIVLVDAEVAVYGKRLNGVVIRIVDDSEQGHALDQLNVDIIAVARQRIHVVTGHRILLTVQAHIVLEGIRNFSEPQKVRTGCLIVHFQLPTVDNYNFSLEK